MMHLSTILHDTTVLPLCQTIVTSFLAIIRLCNQNFVPPPILKSITNLNNLYTKHWLRLRRIYRLTLFFSLTSLNNLRRRLFSPSPTITLLSHKKQKENSINLSIPHSSFLSNNNVTIKKRRKKSPAFNRQLTSAALCNTGFADQHRPHERHDRTQNAHRSENLCPRSDSHIAACFPEKSHPTPDCQRPQTVRRQAFQQQIYRLAHNIPPLTISAAFSIFITCTKSEITNATINIIATQNSPATSSASFSSTFFKRPKMTDAAIISKTTDKNSPRMSVIGSVLVVSTNNNPSLINLFPPRFPPPHLHLPNPRNPRLPLSQWHTTGICDCKAPPTCRGFS